MPFASRRQARWAHATGQPFAKRWDKLTDFGALPEKKDSGATGMAIPTTGNNALFNQPGIQSRRRRKKRKAVCTCTEKAATGAPGEKIAPGITRIRGNLCNVHGRYGPCDKGTAGGKKPAKGRAAKKPPKSEAQRAAERQQRQTERAAETSRQQALNLTKVGEETGLDDHLANLDQFAQGKPIRPEDVDELTKRGLLETGSDGAPRKSEQANVLLNAAKRGDTQGAKDAMSRAADQVAKRGEQAVRRTEVATRRQAAEAKRQTAQAERAARLAGKKPSGGSKKPAAEIVAKPPRAFTPAKRRSGGASGATGPSVGGSAPKPKPAVPKPEKPAAPQIAPALRDAVQALSEGAAMTDEQLGGLIRNGLARLDKNGDPVLTAAGLNVTKKAAHLFTVYKDSAGADRWLAITTTAYQDKDREIISTNAIKEAVLLGDATKERGPLLYWHVSGLPMGDCDFQAQGGPGGRFLIEGGTFRSKAMATLGQKLSASGYQMSPGFIHGDDQPRGGVYDHILIYERSPVPNNRASNHFTRYATAKEDRVLPPLPPEKIAEYREKAAGNAEALALLDTLLATTQKEDDAAQARNVVFKDAPEWAQALLTRIDGLEATVKAFPPAAAAEEEAAVETQDIATEEADDGMVEDAGMDDAAFAQMIAQAVVQAITPLLDIEKKMAGHMADLKSTMGGYAQSKDDATAAQAAQIAALDAKLKELTGDLPSSVMNGARTMYRASESPLTKLTTEGESKVKEIAQQIPTGLTEPNEIAAYQLIFGNT